MFTFLFAIIGDSYSEVKEKFQHSPTVRDDAMQLAAHLAGEVQP
jgi:hypothetical protein